MPSFCVPTLGDLTDQQSPPPGICHPRQKKRGGAEGLGTDGIDRCIKPTTVYVTVTAFHAPGYRASGYQILEQV